VSGDLRATEGLRLDVQALPFRERCFDLIYCSHVLNMVDDDVQALSEIGRVLATGGTAVVQIPLATDPETVSASKDWNQALRQSVFGDPNMAHRHGRDVLRRFAQTGLRIQRIDQAGEFGRTDFERLGLLNEDLLICRRENGPHPAGPSPDGN